jgi:hypothetical protein
MAESCCLLCSRGCCDWRRSEMEARAHTGAVPGATSRLINTALGRPTDVRSSQTDLTSLAYHVRGASAGRAKWCAAASRGAPA